MWTGKEKVRSKKHGSSPAKPKKEPKEEEEAQENDDEGEEGEDAEEEEEKECDPEVAPPPEDKKPAPKCTAAKSLATPETLKKRKQAPQASEKNDRLRRLQSKVRRAQQGSPAIPLTEHAKTLPSPMGFVFDATMKTSSIFMSARLVPTITVNPIHKFACGTELRTGGNPTLWLLRARVEPWQHSPRHYKQQKERSCESCVCFRPFRLLPHALLSV